ncbi:MAG: phosphoadenylyl-sulfate reductase [Xanthobacteraceae bacterium]|nr:phosphoadenylyl-sulfate reductase [Xanthobacteraceae bacterium]
MTSNAASFMFGGSLASSAPMLARAAQLDARLEHASPAEIIGAALNEVGRDKLALVSSFGTESAALLKFAADVNSAIPVIFLDTGWLFEETLAYRDALTKLFGLSDVRTIHPLADELASEDKGRDLWFSDPDKCCFIRKVEPLARALAPFEGWLNGRKRFQGGDRAAIPVVEADHERLKFNPLANVTQDELKTLYGTMNIPPHPLVASGFTSIGCMPCTSRTAPGEDARAGRWRGRDKTECGIHVGKTS